jgi:hypothetical protein
MILKYWRHRELPPWQKEIQHVIRERCRQLCRIFSISVPTGGHIKSTVCKHWNWTDHIGKKLLWTS